MSFGLLVETFVNGICLQKVPPPYKKSAAIKFEHRCSHKKFLTQTCPNNTTCSPHLSLRQPLSPMPAHDDFMSTPDFSRRLLSFLSPSMFLTVRCLSREWRAVAQPAIDGIFEGGTLLVHDGKDINQEDAYSRSERRVSITQVMFLLNITRVGEYACKWAVNLATVEIPEGVTSIGCGAFWCCSKLTSVTFPKTLANIQRSAFNRCSSLEVVNLLHTDLQEIQSYAFEFCLVLKSVKVPASLRKIIISPQAFSFCNKLKNQPI